MPPEVIIHHLDQARDVLHIASKLGCAVQLCSAPGAANYAGVGYLHALGQAVHHDLIIDCGHDPGLAMAALRTGCRKIRFSGQDETRKALRDMANQVQAELLDPPEDERPSLALLMNEEPGEVLSDWLRRLPSD